MAYQTQYNYCAMIIYFIILFFFIVKRKTKEISNNFFVAVVTTSMGGCAVNILNTSGNMNEVNIPHNVLLVLDYAYFVFLNLSLFLFAIYAVMLTKNKFSTLNIKVKLALILPISCFFAMLISNPWTGGIFKYTDGIYGRGEWQILMYVFDIFYGIFGAIYVIHERESTTFEMKASILLFVIIGLFLSMVQFLFPRYLLQHLGLAVCELIAVLCIQKPEEYLDIEMKAYNKNAFDRIFNLNVNSKKEMYILILHLCDINYLMQTVGFQNEKSISREIADFLNLESKRNLYFLDQNTMVVIRDEKKDFYNMIEQISNRFENKWGSGESETIMNYKMMFLNVPYDLEDIKKFYYSVNYLIENTVRNGHELFVKDIDFNKAERKIKVEKIIKRAIENDHFEMYYQPIYSIKKNKIVSAEALVRLIDPAEGFVSPAEFIPIAEENGTILKIGDMVFEKVFEFMSRERLHELGIEYIEINLSVVQCVQSELASKVMRMLSKYEISKDMVNLEITETAAAESPKTLIDNMSELSDKGITFSLDDFGTGYSNICALMSLPLNIIKLDKTLIDMATNSNDGKNIIDSSVAMVKKMGKKIVAEGIEEKKQVEMLWDSGIDYIQGYYYSKPLSSVDFIRYLRENNA